MLWFIGYVICYVLALYMFLKLHKRFMHGTIKAGDLVFYGILSLAGPLCMLTGLVAYVAESDSGYAVNESMFIKWLNKIIK